MSIPLFPVLEYVVISYVILPLHCKCQCMPVSAPAAFVQPADTPHQVLTQHVGSVPLSPHPTKGKRLSWPVLCQYRYHALKLSGSRLACSYPQQKARGKNNVRYWRVVHLRVDNASIYSTNVICCFNAIMCSLGCYHKQSWFQKHFFFVSYSKIMWHIYNIKYYLFIYEFVLATLYYRNQINSTQPCGKIPSC